MRLPVSAFLIGTLILSPVLASGKTFVVPHVLERSGTINVVQSGDAGQSAMPSVQELEQMIQSRTGLTGIKWNNPIGRSSRHVKLTGTGTMGDNLSVNINCTVSYPPLSIRCTISASW
jgi:hypothetical protein